MISTVSTAFTVLFFVALQSSSLLLENTFNNNLFVVGQETTTSTTTGTTSTTTIGQLICSSGSTSDIDDCIETMNSSNNNDNDNNDKSIKKKPIRIAFIGNSIQYYNDCPRLVQQMLHTNGYTVEQDSCLKGGATISSLWKEGNGMKHKFHSDAAIVHPITHERHSKGHHDKGSATIKELLSGRQWDYLVLNDYTQGPARDDYRTKTIQTLQQHIVPLLVHEQQDTVTIPIIIQTQAYRREKIKDTEDLGNFDQFTKLLHDGVHEYSRVLNNEIQTRLVNNNKDSITSTTVRQLQQDGSSFNNYARVAPVGEAYSLIRTRYPTLFRKLYSWDEFHPSPYGTWLQACILYMTIVGNDNNNNNNDLTQQQQPPTYNPSWWKQSRYIMPSPDGDQYYQVEFPTLEEAELLRQIAIEICTTTTSTLSSSSSSIQLSSM